MSQFQKFNFDYFGGYLTYNRVFVSRFKYSVRDKAQFISFLTKNFSVEEYFHRLDNGESPVKILESKGYVSTTIKRLLKSAGLPRTQAGYNEYIAGMMASPL